MIAKELIFREPLCLGEHKTLLDAKMAFELHDADVLAVLRPDGTPHGVLSRRNLQDYLRRGNSLSTPLPQLTTEEFVCISDTSDVRTVFDKDILVALVVSSDKKVKALVTKQDLLRAYYDKLEVTNTNLHAILGAVNAALVAIDKDGKITYVNGCAKELLEVQSRPLVGTSIEQFLPEASMREVALAFNVQTSFKATMMGKSYSINAVPIKGKTNPAGAVLVLADDSREELLRSQLHEEKNHSEILQTILDIAYDGIVVVDAQGIITMMSRSYLNFIDLTRDQVIGRHVTDVIENTRMHIVIETGIPEVADIQRIKGSYMVATRIPIFSGGQVIGAIGKVLFRNIDDLASLYQKIGKMEEQLQVYKGQLNRSNRARYSFADIVGRSEALSLAKRQATKAAASDTTVLLLGESGVGKEIFAQAIHTHSKRANQAFIKVNCAAIPNELMETEFFGYEEGTFPGAKVGGKIGKFEAADGGTIFLDEIADMPLPMQAKILRVLQEREIEKIGAVSPQKVDVRVIVSSNQDLEERVRTGRLRQDLYYRINAWTLTIPPLRQRKEDIEDLVEHILDKYSHKHGKYVEKVSERAMALLYKYSWPGNVRELENEIARSVGLLDNGWVVLPEHLSEKITGAVAPPAIRPLEEVLLAAEKQALADSLQICTQNKSCAAKLLGISRSSLYEKLLKHGFLQ